MTDKERFLDLIQSLHLTTEQIVRKYNALQNKQFKDEDGKSVLHHANTRHAVQTLIQLGVAINETDNLGNTPLHYLAQSDAHLEIVKFLLDKAQYKIKNHAGFRPEEIASDENKKLLQLQHRYDRCLKTELKFFDYQRLTHVTRDYYAVRFYRIRRQARTQTEKIDLTAIPRRIVIAADSGACQTSFANDAEIKALSTATTIAEKSGWYNGGCVSTQGKKANINWGGEAMVYQVGTKSHVVKSQFRPVIGQLNNFFMSGIGSYGEGDTKDILQILNGLTAATTDAQRNQKSKTLARLLLNSIREGRPIHTQLLKDNHLTVPADKTKDKLDAQLARIYHLICVKEISRRLMTDYKEGQLVKKLPIGMSLVMALELLESGHIGSFSQIFEHDAQFGLPTPSSLSTDRELERAKQKMFELIKLYATAFPGFEFKRQNFRDKLGHYYRGEADTDSEYTSSDDERVQARLA